METTALPVVKYYNSLFYNIYVYFSHRIVYRILIIIQSIFECYKWVKSNENFHEIVIVCHVGTHGHINLNRKICTMKITTYKEFHKSFHSFCSLH